jgi:hypothetical protein
MIQPTMTVKILRPILFSFLILLISCQQVPNSDDFLSTVIERQLKANVPPEYVYDKENIVVVTVGTASPIPGERAQTGTAIFVNGYFFIFDVGPSCQ